MANAAPVSSRIRHGLRSNQREASAQFAVSHGRDPLPPPARRRPPPARRAPLPPSFLPLPPRPDPHTTTCAPSGYTCAHVAGSCGLCLLVPLVDPRTMARGPLLPPPAPFCRLLQSSCRRVRSTELSARAQSWGRALPRQGWLMLREALHRSLRRDRTLVCTDNPFHCSCTLPCPGASHVCTTARAARQLSLLRPCQ